MVRCGVVPGQGNNKEGVNVLNVRIWVEGAVLEYEPRYIENSLGGNFDYIWACRGSAWKPIQTKILRRKEYDEDSSGGPIQRRLLVCWLNKGGR